MTAPVAGPSASGLAAAASATAVTVPHAVGLGLIAFAPLAGLAGAAGGLAALALWSAALPGLLLALWARRAGVVHAPTTVVALMFGAVSSVVVSSAADFSMNARQVLAAVGAVIALGFVFQWLLGVFRAATLARFLPIPVTHGFAAGVGLAIAVAQYRSGFGTGQWPVLDGVSLAHAAVAVGVLAVAWALQRRWPRVPALLPAVVVVALLATAVAPTGWLRPAVSDASFGWPWLPDWAGVPWRALAQRHGAELVSMAMLMALVNSLEILVFNQELELDHGIRDNANAALRRESIGSAMTALVGMIPASTSASRSRIVLAQAGASRSADAWHAGLMLGVACTGVFWLGAIPLACLAGGLVLAGLRQVPLPMWSARYAHAAPATFAQSWLVAGVFVLAGGAGALVAGLAVATFVLLRASATTALRHARVDGELRSRRLRRASSEVWIAPRMNQVAVFELQGVMSFGVAAHLAEQVRGALLPRHTHVVIDAGRVPAWDSTALARLRALVRDLALQGAHVAVAALDTRAQAEIGAGVLVLPDLDRALQWAEDELLNQRALGDRPTLPEHEPLGELGEGLSTAAREALERQLVAVQIPQGSMVFDIGDAARELYVVQAGHATMVTHWPPARGLRLATIGRGMAFGELAFLTGGPRTACAGADDEALELMRLSREAFDRWSTDHPRDALQFMENLAHIGARRLSATTRQLRAVLE